MVMSGNIILTERGQKLLKIINQGADRWQSRREIAQQIDPDRTKLHADEVAILDILVLNGIVESKEEDFPGPMKKQTFYCAKSN